MSRSLAKSPGAARARALVEELQAYFAENLSAISTAWGGGALERVEWLRDGGRHGGGDRYVAVETPVFNRLAINVSGVHYDDDPNKSLSSADALSTIIHPANSLAPSVHMHLSWTEMRDGRGYYRVMADLNPCIEDASATRQFLDALQDACPEHFAEAVAQGDRYFLIPALQRHRGVAHFYLEGFSTGDFEADTAMARKTVRAAMDVYLEILREALKREPGETERAAQLAYHTAYLFQVLTLDRGTTSGLLVHDQNDLGIMGSLPAYVDRALLLSWKERAPAPQRALVQALVEVLRDESPSHITDEVRVGLAQAVRAHYRAHPEALALQAAGNSTPPTVENHQ